MDPLQIVLQVIAFACAGIAIMAFFAPVAWTVSDAQRHGYMGSVVPLILLFGPLAALIWLVSRPRLRLAERNPDDYSSPEDALDAAARLDQFGEWEAAIALYENVAKRWLDQKRYVAACLQQLKWKQALL